MGPINNILSDGNYRSDNNTTISTSSLSDGAAAVAVASPWVRRVQYLIGYASNDAFYLYYHKQ